MSQQGIITFLEHISMLLLDLIHKGVVQDKNIKKELRSLGSALKKGSALEDYRLIFKNLVALQPKIVTHVLTQVPEQKLVMQLIEIMTLFQEEKGDILHQLVREHAWDQISDHVSEILPQLERNSKGLHDCRVRYNDVSELLERTLRVIAKIPKKGCAFQERLGDIRGKIQGAKSIDDVKILKEELLGGIRDIESGLEEMGQEVGDLLNFQLNHAHATIEHLQMELQRSEASVLYDPMTGAFNREWMKQKFDELFWFGQSEKMAGLMIDIDHFKRVNDTYGHPVGDEVLKELVIRIQKDLKPEESLIRMGGEEFLVLLRDVDDFLQRAEAIRTMVADKPFKTNKGLLDITISIGGSFFYEGVQPDIFIELTDQKLYTAKASGRNCSVL